MSASEALERKLTESVRLVRGVGTQRAELLFKLGIKTASDLLFHFPRRYEDFTEQHQIHSLELNQMAQVMGTVNDIDETKKDSKHILYVLLKQDKCFLRGIWFNQEYMLNKFRFGQTVQFRGKVVERGGRLQMTHPSVIWIDDPEAVRSGGLQPIYALTEGINQRGMRKMVTAVVEDYGPLLQEAFPKELQKTTGAFDIQTAVNQIHFPSDQKQLELARHRFVFQELLILQLALAIRRFNVRSRETAPELELLPKIQARILNRFPFPLRESQRTVFLEIAQDMGRAYPMNRLLHGEVGSGKTVVASCAMMLATAHQHQAVMMAPTEILAHQHFQTLQHLLAGSRVRIALVTGSQSRGERRQVNEDCESGKINIVVGTNAVVSSDIRFAKLGLVVIDEQHKFGVKQRALLKASGFDPHYLVMTATPIPRTVSMTLFGDLDVSVLKDVPRNVKTYLSKAENRDKWWQFFVKKLREGRQGFVVAPYVDSDEESRIKSAESLFESLANGHLSEFRLELLHGKQLPDEKQRAMLRFRRGDAQVLVATGVVEVGIDVPNATVMTIESAERFGLSQLHQLRGRVGRGKHPGYVCAFPSEGVSDENERLVAFRDVHDGFELAQIDLQLRGPGNLLSTSQTGFPPLKIADLVRDEELLIQAQMISRQIIDADPSLGRVEYQRLRKLVISRYGKSLELGDVG